MEKVSPAQSRILVVLWERDEISARELSTLTSLDKSTLSLSLSRMEQMGIVRRTVDAGDRRVVRISLTEHGKAFRPICVWAMNELTDILYRGVEAQDAEVFRRVLAQVFRNLSDQEQTHAP